MPRYKNLIFLSLFSFALFSVGTAFGVGDNDPSCQKIEKACYDAGFIRGVNDGKSAKDLDKGCKQPILKGQDVSGVKVDSDTVKQCQEAQKQKPINQKHHRHP